MSAATSFSKKILLAFCSALVLAQSARAAEDAFGEEPYSDFYSTTVTIGILDTLDRESDKSLLEYLIRRLNNTSRQYSFKPITISTHDVESCIYEHRPDFMLAPASFQAMTNNNIPFYRIATRKNTYAKSADHSQGAVIFALNSRTDINSLRDLDGKILGSAAPSYLPVWLSAMREFNKAGMNVKEVNEHSMCTSIDPLSALRNLYDYKIDALILPTCLIEELSDFNQFSFSSLKILNEKTDSSLSCLRSTDLYPDISLIGFEWSDPEVAKKITIEVLLDSLQSNADWIPFVPHENIDELYKDLHLGPYAGMMSRDIASIYRSNPWAFNFAFLLLLVLASYSSVLKYLVKKRTQMLSLSLERQKNLERSAKIQRERMGALERRNIVNQMSGMIAHEIKSPIGSICNFKSVLDILIGQQGAMNEQVKRCLDGISYEAHRISEIIDRVRKYAKSQNIPHKKCDLVKIARKALSALSAKVNEHYVRVLIEPSEAFVSGDPLELELLILNLLNNAVQVESTSQIPMVELRINSSADDLSWVVEVRDFGVAISDEAFAELQTSLKSMKPEGLGMGLSIVRGISDSHGGKLEFVRQSPNGLSALFYIDKVDKNDTGHEDSVD